MAKPWVIDTMVFAYALLGEPQYGEESLEVLIEAKRSGIICVPDSFQAELVIVLWQWSRKEKANLELGREILRDTLSIVSSIVPCNTIWERALSFSLDRNHPAYDTLFIALAEQMETKVISYDRALLKTFPEFAIHPKSVLG